MKELRLALVVQRYGDVVGGAELLARQYAEKLNAEPNINLEVLTTTALDYVSWKNHFREGETTISGVRVLRFRTNYSRNIFIFRTFHHLTYRVLKYFNLHFAGRGWLRPFERIWYFLQGPNSKELISYIKENSAGYDGFIFVTYLYAPTVFGLPLVADRSILVPALHDEASAYFYYTEILFKKARYIFANTRGEYDLICTLFPFAKIKTRVVGAGVNNNEPDQEWPENVPEGCRYILYLGRISKGKGVLQLIKYYQQLVRETGDNVKLVLAGKVDDTVRLPEEIIYTGFVSDTQKIKLLSNARVVVNFSEYESLSFIVLESLLLFKPVVVNRKSKVLDYYTQVTPTVYSFDSYNEFKEITIELLKSEWQTTHSNELAASKKWVLENCSWSSIINQFRAAIESINGVHH